MRHQRKRPELRERAEIFSLQLSPRLNKRSRSRITLVGQIRHNPLSGSCVYCTRGAGYWKAWGVKKGLYVVTTQRALRVDAARRPSPLAQVIRLFRLSF